MPTWVWLLIVGGIAVVAVAAFNVTDGNGHSPLAAPHVGMTACTAHDLTCLGNDATIRAVSACVPKVEALNDYSVSWIDGAMESKFSRFRWLDESAGTLTLIGDKAEFQNQFGAMQRVIYFCDFDPATEQALDARFMPGRLPS